MSVFQDKTNDSFHNREDIDFALASELPPTEELVTIAPDVAISHHDIIEYPVKRQNFNNVRNITLYIEDNWSQGDEDVSQMWYIGFKGEWTELKDVPLVAVYEVCPSSGIIDIGTRESSGSQEGAFYDGWETWSWALGMSKSLGWIGVAG